MYWSGVLKRLDWNAKGSWLLYLFGGVSLYLAVTKTKNLSRREWILLSGMVGFYGWMANIILFFIFDLMDSGDKTIGGLPDLVMFVVGPVSAALLFLNKYRSPTRIIWAIAFSIMSYLCEWLLRKVGFLKMKGWKPYYSIPFYLLSFGVLLPWTIKLVKKR